MHALQQFHVLKLSWKQWEVQMKSIEGGTKTF